MDLNETVPSYWRTTAFVVFIVAVACGFFILGNKVLTNSTAIEKSCILLSNAIVRSQAQQANPNSQTSILIGTIIKQMDQETFSRFRKAPPMTLPPINCEHVADHPDSIRATPTTTVPPRSNNDGSPARSGAR